VPAAHLPIKVVSIAAQKTVDVMDHCPLSPEDIKEQIKENYEFHVLGKV